MPLVRYMLWMKIYDVSTKLSIFYEKNYMIHSLPLRHGSCRVRLGSSSMNCSEVKKV